MPFILLSCYRLVQMRREVRVMRHLSGHDRIVCLYETLEKDRWLYLVMEHCAGGNLFEYVSSRKSLSEPEAARLSLQLIQGLSYCHSKGVSHRDLKLENVSAIHCPSFLQSN